MDLFKEGINRDIDNKNELESKSSRRSIHLKSEKSHSPKELIKPWGVEERLFVFLVLLVTVLISGALSLSARNFKLPNLPKISLPDFSKLNPFKEEIIIVGNKGSEINFEKIENIKRLFREATNGYSGIYAFYIYDINGDYYYGVNHKEKMQAASLIKLPVMYLAIQDEKNYDAVLEMGKRSDNKTFLNMVDILGRESIKKAIIDLGMINTSFDKNVTTPEDIGIFLKKLYKKEILNESLRSKFIDSLINTNFEKWLRLGIPFEIPLAHKYGREAHSVNDAGIVLTDRPFVMVIMTDGVIEKEADKLFPKLTKMLYDNHAGILEQ